MMLGIWVWALDHAIGLAVVAFALMVALFTIEAWRFVRWWWPAAEEARQREAFKDFIKHTRPKP
jgi:hypothetical protein